MVCAPLRYEATVFWKLDIEMLTWFARTTPPAPRATRRRRRCRAPVRARPTKIQSARGHRMLSQPKRRTENGEPKTANRKDEPKGRTGTAKPKCEREKAKR